MAGCVNSSSSLISQKKLRGIQRNLGKTGKFGKFRENSGEISGIEWGLVYSGDLVPRKAFCANSQGREEPFLTCLVGGKTPRNP